MKQPTRNIKIYSLSILLMAFFTMSLSGANLLSSRDYYQIQVYHINGKAQEEKLDNYLRNAYLPALHRAGIQKVGVFKPIESDPNAGTCVYIWMPFKSLEQFDKILKTLGKDEEYQTRGSNFLGAPFDQAPFIRQESILLKAFKDAPKFFIPIYSTAPSQRIYELRSYEGPTENLFRQKVKMFNEEGEAKLFEKLGFNALFFAEVISGSTMPNLMYLTTFADMTSHDEHWKSFVDHPKWKKMSALEEYQNTVSHAVVTLLHPTDYSDF